MEKTKVTPGYYWARLNKEPVKIWRVLPRHAEEDDLVALKHGYAYNISVNAVNLVFLRRISEYEPDLRTDEEVEYDFDRSSFV